MSPEDVGKRWQVHIKYPVRFFVDYPLSVWAKDEQQELNSKTLLGLAGGFTSMFKKFPRREIEVEKVLGKWFQSTMKHQTCYALVKKSTSEINSDVLLSDVQSSVRENKVMGKDGFSIIEAFRTASKDGPVHTYKRDLSKSNTGEYWMFTEDYFYPRQCNYFYLFLHVKLTLFVFDVGPIVNNSYEYIIITDANRISLSVYARDPAMFHKMYDAQVTDVLNKGGFGGYAFWNRPVAIYQGLDCVYTEEKEIFIRRSLKQAIQDKSTETSQILNSARQLFAPTLIAFKLSVLTHAFLLCNAISVTMVADVQMAENVASVHSVMHNALIVSFKEFENKTSIIRYVLNFPPANWQFCANLDTVVKTA
ncbi:conserved hypothetical protein [Trichinella spiralis]|uniref:hypothetical protein n=1 Tax=Trichinella spiralis TaxID=6334 RepID=UPI0001EFB8D5|nr:conserved hypothetical protein [Trichinella spiralis]